MIRLSLARAWPGATSKARGKLSKAGWVRLRGCPRHGCRGQAPKDGFTAFPATGPTPPSRRKPAFAFGCCRCRCLCGCRAAARPALPAGFAYVAAESGRGFAGMRDCPAGMKCSALAERREMSVTCLTASPLTFKLSAYGGNAHEPHLPACMEPPAQCSGCGLGTGHRR